MKHEEFEKAATESITKNRYPAKDDGHFGPSQISGCPLRVFLDKMTDTKFEQNSYTFAGSSVHHHLQENGILDEALREAGYHPAFTEYEKTTRYKVKDGVFIHGSCDVIAEDESDTVVYDIKFSSIPADSGAGRIYKYFTQAHTYARIFDADGYGLLMINSKNHDPERFAEGITVLEGKMSDENWEKVKDKTEAIYEALVKAGFYEGEDWTDKDLEEAPDEFWSEVAKTFNLDTIPSYSDECKYCEHSDYCPEQNGVFGGVQSLL
jgi:hypothetical protein